MKGVARDIAFEDHEFGDVHELEPKVINNFVLYKRISGGLKIPFRWVNARLQYLQCVSNGVTAVLH